MASQYYLKEVPVGFGERLSTAVAQFFALVAQGCVAFCLAPIVAIRCLFITKRTVVMMGEAPAGHVNPPTSYGNDDEDWMKEHNSLYGK